MAPDVVGGEAARAGTAVVGNVDGAGTAVVGGVVLGALVGADGTETVVGVVRGGEVAAVVVVGPLTTIVPCMKE